MKYLIIEDEDPAALRLQKMITEAEPSAVMVKHLVSVKSSVEYLIKNAHPDLIFMDIRLADGDSFEIFKKVEPKCPVIFTTAYDHYAVNAFKVNSIGYLLKPVKLTELQDVLSKYRKLGYSQDSGVIDYSKIAELIQKKAEFQKRILTRFGDTLKTIEVSDIAYFYTEQKNNFLKTFAGADYPIDQTLDQVEQMVDPAEFFRINRQIVVNIKAIKKMVTYSKSRVKLILEPHSDHDLIVSTNRSPVFKNWLTGT